MILNLYSMIMTRLTITAMTKSEVVFVLVVGTFFHQTSQAQGEDYKEERPNCNSDAMVVAMSACQEPRHKLSLASRSNDTAKLCGALQRYSRCMAPRLDGCKGATRMAFDVIRTKYIDHYNCNIVTKPGNPTIPYDGPGSTPFNKNTNPTKNDDFSTPRQPIVQNTLPKFHTDYNYNHNDINKNDDDDDNNNSRNMTKATKHPRTLRWPTQSVKISNAVGDQSVMSIITTTNETTTNTNTVSSTSNSSTSHPTSRGDQHLTTKHVKPIVHINDENKNVNHPPSPNTTSPYSNSNATLIIFNPAHTNKSSSLRHPTYFIVVIIAQYCCLSLRL